MGAAAFRNDRSIGGMAMKKQIISSEINAQALELAKAVRSNQERKRKDRVDHSVTVVIDEDRALVVCGSAHQLTGMFVDLIKERPEFRQVMEDAIRQYGYSNHWKL